MGDDSNVLAAYDFLLERARTQETFTADDLGEASGWTAATPKTYLSKQLRSVVRKAAQGTYWVKKSFIHLRQEDFRRRVSQKESILPSYTRSSYESVLTYEFLMPLTREHLLRGSLDLLLYRNTLEDQIRLVGLDEFAHVMPRTAAEEDSAYCSRIARQVGEYFGGYSITHVSGRFRGFQLLSQQDAINKRYVIDETTALVRFIIPLQTSKTPHGETFEPDAGTTPNPDRLKQEVRLVRKLFFEIFAEVVVHSVQGEDEIWLLETLDGQHKLYKWEVERSD